MDKFIIDYVASTISGEGKYAGYPCTLIRLSGCNLKCSFCDSIPSEYPKSLGTKELMEVVSRYNNKYVLITGGEPLLQSKLVIPLMYELAYGGYVGWIETNGSLPIEKCEYRRRWGYCMDIKCPSSEVSQYNKYSNLGNLQSIDEVKFVIGNYADYIFARGIIKQYPTTAGIVFSPCFDKDGEHNGHDLAEWMLQDKITDIRLGIQIHKFIDVI